MRRVPPAHKRYSRSDGRGDKRHLGPHPRRWRRAVRSEVEFACLSGCLQERQVAHFERDASRGRAGAAGSARAGL